MADHGDPSAPLIAETGGLNAMIVDSTALPDQVVRDVLASAFQSAGQRCSALRCLYLQEDIAPAILPMLQGAMDALALGNPWTLATDIGPVIDAQAQANITDYIAHARAEGRLIKELSPLKTGTFIAPTILQVEGIGQMPHEIFGPVLHVATFPASALDKVVQDINATGYGLTFGLHSRIDDRVQSLVAQIHVGNIYVNRNQIGAVVGSQPFGGEGLSGTGPKAGGPHYLARFTQMPPPVAGLEDSTTDEAIVQNALRDAPASQALGAETLPGRTGESTRLIRYARPPILCLGPSAATAQAQARSLRTMGAQAIEAPGLDPAALTTLQGFSAVLWWGSNAQARVLAQHLSQRKGPILPLICDMPDAAHAQFERHICIDTTASGGNAQLLAGA
jgi:RHH-type proline utilization regulon transcriptional repressor/proline dehydrogenase/delta 1-pyrroline-5-carboxylate dehydrogenase